MIFILLNLRLNHTLTRFDTDRGDLVYVRDYLTAFNFEDDLIGARNATTYLILYRLGTVLLI